MKTGGELIIVLIPLIFFPQSLPWNRFIYDIKLGDWLEKAGNPSPHPNLRIPASIWGPNFNTPLLLAFSGLIQINMKLYTHLNMKSYTHLNMKLYTYYSNVPADQRAILTFQHVILTYALFWRFNCSQRIILIFQL